MRHLSLEGKITIFKSLAISKIVYLALLTIVPKNVIFELKKFKINFYGQIKKVKLNTQHSVMIIKLEVCKMLILNSKLSL